MPSRRMVLHLILIMAAVVIVAAGLTIHVLYRAAFEQRRDSLVNIAKSSARLMEAIARFDARNSPGYPGGSAEATLSQIREAHTNFQGFGKTGEFTLARSEGDKFVFLLRKRGRSHDIPPPIPLASELAEPMRRALAGRTGTLVGLDYLGNTVLAAHEPVAELDLGVVAKIDLDEVRAPFIRAGLLAAGSALVLILLGSLLFRRIGNPLIHRLQESHALMDAVIEGTWDAIFVKDRDSRYVLANSAKGRSLGSAKEKVVGKRDADFQDERIAAARVRDDQQVMATGETAVFEESSRTEAGTRRWLSTKSPYRDSKGNIIGVLGVAHDITELKAAQDEARGLAAKNEALLAAVPDILVEADSDKVYTWTNPAGLEFFGKDVLGSEAADYFVGEQDTYSILQPLHDGLEEEIYVESLQRRRDGAERLLAWWCRCLRDGEGDVQGTLSTARDITDQRIAEERRKQLEAQVQHTQKLESLGVLAGGIAHDFNNLLTGILGNARLASMALPAGSPAQTNLRRIDQSSQRAADLCKQMLAYSGKGQFVISVIDVSALVNEMLHILEVSISKKAVFRLDLPENLPAIEADAAQVRQIVMNLITNASEAIGERSGVIAVSTGAMECDREYLKETFLDGNLCEGVYVYFEVSDTGCGMDAETQEKIFDPFFTTKFAGRGLGMAAVLGIMRGHKGAIKIFSEPGRGTTAKVLFPASESAVDVQPGRPTSSEGRRGSGTVLVVDDEETIRTVAKQVLETTGFTVLLAEDGRKAIEVFKEHSESIVMVLLDLTMPHLDGPETFRELRRILPGVQVILSSGYNEPEATEGFAGKGLAGFLQKPYDPMELVDRLFSMLDAES